MHRSDEFQHEVGRILQRDRRDIRLYVSTMVKAGRIAVDQPDPSPETTIGREAARILAAIASRKLKDTSVVRVAECVRDAVRAADAGDPV